MSKEVDVDDSVVVVPHRPVKDLSAGVELERIGVSFGRHTVRLKDERKRTRRVFSTWMSIVAAEKDALIAPLREAARDQHGTR